MSTDLDLSAIQQEGDKNLAGDVSENVAEDIIHVSRGNVIANESHTLLSTLCYTTGWMYDMTRFDNSVLIGPSSGGKTQVQKCAKELVPAERKFSRTNASGQALLESDEWDYALVAPMDEYDKIGSEIREFMKSMAGEDEGMSRERSVQDQESETGFDTATLSSNPMPFQFLYATDNAGKAGLDNELANRMIELYVEDNIHIREAIARKNHGHTDIEIKGYPHTYVYETDETEATIREHIRSMPTYTYDGEGEDTHEVGFEGRRGGLYVEEPEWVYYATRPIYNFKKTYTNRVTNQVANLFAASAALNYKNRRTQTVRRGGEEVQAYVIEPQDVANVLSTQPTLLATTHKLDPRKRAILESVNKTAGLSDSGWTTLDQIREYLDDNDMPLPSESVMRSILKDELREDWFIRVNDGAGPQGADLFKPRTESGVQTPLTHGLDDYAEMQDDVYLESDYVDIDRPFKDCVDPIRNQPFEETVDQFDVEIAGGTEDIETDDMSAAAVMGSGSSDGSSDDTTGQATLDGDTASDTDEVEREGEPSGVVEEWLHDRLEDTLGESGSPYGEHHNVAHYAEIVDTDVDKVLQADIKETVLDPNHELWEHDSFADDRVIDSNDALGELADALISLENKQVIYHDSNGAVPNGFTLLRWVAPTE